MTETESNRFKDPINGYLTVLKCPITQAGIIQYRAFEIGLKDGDPTRVINVYRPEEVVNNQDFLDSLKLIPITVGHTFLSGDPKNTKDVSPEENKYDGVVSNNVWYEDGWVYADIKLFTKRAQRLLNSHMRSLSLGATNINDYHCKGVFEGQPYDVKQLKLVANHLAMTDIPRVKGARIMDDLTQFNKGTNEMDETTKQIEEILARLDKLEKPKDAKNPDAEATTTPEETSTARTQDADPAVDPIEEITQDIEVPALDPSAISIAANDDGSTTITLPPADPVEAIRTQDCSDAPLKATRTQDEEAQNKPEGSISTQEDLSKKIQRTEDSNALFNLVNQQVSQQVKAREMDRERMAKMYDRASKIIGAFNYRSCDSSQDLACYIIGKLGFKNVPPGHEMTALNTFLATNEQGNRTVTIGRSADSAAVFAQSSPSRIANSKLSAFVGET